MSLISFNGLVDLVDAKVIEGVEYDHINSTSIDLVLGDTIYVERDPRPDMMDGQHWPVIDMLDKSNNHLQKLVMGPEGYIVPPGSVLLAHTTQVFNLPNDISAEYKLKSTQARNFMGHLLAGWADAGWNGSVLTLEFVNHNQWHAIRIKPGMKCGQMIFMSHEEVPADRSYAARGQYNGDKTVMTGKGLK